MIAFGRMRAIVVREFGPPDVMKLETVPTPVPGPSQVLVRVRAAGVNPVETYIRAGVYARKPSLPYIPGSDGAGEVETVGAEVKNFKHGDRVYIAGDNVTTVAGAGTYAEYALCSEAMLHRLPARVSFGQGAAIGVPYGTAYRALFGRAERQAGGNRARARRDGRRRHRRRADRARPRPDGHRQRRHRSRAGARPRTGRSGRRQPQGAELSRRRSMRATNGRGVDVILEMAAHINLDKDLALLAPRGRVVVDRQPRTRRDRPAADDGPRRGDSRHDAVQRDTRPSSRPFTRRSSPASRTARSIRSSAARWRSPTRHARTKPSWNRARSARSCWLSEPGTSDAAGGFRRCDHSLS